MRTLAGKYLLQLAGPCPQALSTQKILDGLSDDAASDPYSDQVGRLAENGSGGTNHGRGGVQFLIGGSTQR